MSPSETLRVAVARHKAHNDSISPPESPDERARRLLRQARQALDRCAMFESPPDVVALRAAVGCLLEAIEEARR
jgi:hypothetical protein